MVSERFLKKIVKEYHEQFNTNKFYNSEEMDTFLKSYKLPRLEARRNWIRKKLTIWTYQSPVVNRIDNKNIKAKEKSWTRWLHTGESLNI